MNVPKLLSRIFGVVACLVLILGLYFLQSNHRLKSEGVHVTGTIIENVAVESSYSEDGYTRTRIFYHPKVRIKDENGKDFVFQSDTGSNPADHLEGDLVEVVYPPGAPENAQLLDSLWLGPVVCFGLGFGFLIFAFAFAYFSKEK